MTDESWPGLPAAMNELGILHESRGNLERPSNSGARRRTHLENGKVVDANRIVRN